MKFAIDARRIQKGMAGLGIHTLHLVRVLAEVSQEHAMVLYILPEYEGFLADPKPWETRVGVKWPPENHLRGEIWKTISCPRDLTRRHVDVFHDPAFQLPWFGMAAKKVVTIHDISPINLPHTNTWRYNLYWTQVIKRSVRTADRIIVVSQYIKNELVDRLKADPDRIDVVHNAVSSQFIPGEPDSGVLRQLNIEGPYLITTAKLEPRKNLGVLLKAVHLLKGMTQWDHRLVVAGGFGWKCKPLIRMLDELSLRDRVIFTGYLDEDRLVSVLRGATAAVVPSIYEGFGLPVLEAMATGIPVISSRLSSLPEVGTDASIYFDPFDAEELSEKIRLVLESGECRENAVVKGLLRSANFSWEQTALNTLKVYERALK